MGGRNARDGQGGYALPAPDEAEPFVRRRLDSDAFERDAEGGCEVRPHPVDIRGDFRRLANERRVDVQKVRPLFPHDGGGFAYDLQAAHAAEGLVGVWKVVAYIPRAHGAENRVGYRVAKNIGVRMAFQPARVRYLDPAENEFPALAETVNVVTYSNHGLTPSDRSSSSRR